MTTPIRVHRRASEELRTAALHYNEQQHGLGSSFLVAIRDARDQLVEWPHLGSPIQLDLPQGEVRWVPVSGFPYRVIYHLSGSTIRVIAFAHDRRRPQYWRRRVGAME